MESETAGFMCPPLIFFLYKIRIHFCISDKIRELNIPDTFPTAIMAMAKLKPNEMFTDKNSFLPLNIY